MSNRVLLVVWICNYVAKDTLEMWCEARDHETVVSHLEKKYDANRQTPRRIKAEYK